MLDLAVARTIDKKREPGSWDPCGSDQIPSSLNVSISPSEGIGLETEGQMCGRGPITRSSFPETGIVHHCILPGCLENNASHAGLLPLTVPSRAGDGLKGPTCHGSSVILTTRGSQACSVRE